MESAGLYGISRLFTAVLRADLSAAWIRRIELGFNGLPRMPIAMAA
jgi:hypothetical protein